MREDGSLVAVCGPAGDPTSEADALLFAAAPDLLGVADLALAAAEHIPNALIRTHLELAARTAIARARGQA
jgi:hypothetical protein